MPDLRALLRRVATIRDLVDLFVTLGYDRHYLPFDDVAHSVARWQGFRVVALQADRPAPAARSLARGLAHRGIRGLAVTIGADTIAIAAPHIGQLSATKAVSIRRDLPAKEHLDVLEALRPESQSNALRHALRLSELLRTEVAGEQFFRAFRDAFHTMQDTLHKQQPTVVRHHVTLLALTRVLFLYFVQAKGWLNGDHRFVRRQLDRALSANMPFHSSTLDALFFGTLNTPTDRRDSTSFDGVPYLNGGLFEQHPIERKARHRHFSNDTWRHTFETVFERFRFCAGHADEIDVIAPDMLGRVFERMMASDTRLATGTFYTPEPLVRQVVAVAIHTALHKQSGGDSSPEAVDRPPPNTVAFRRRLAALQILDPACGSGAFLLGALDCLTDLWIRLEHGHNSSRSALRRRLLERNLFGVDLNPMAVRLAELRLWLAIIADDPQSDVTRVTPLPNLDGVVRQGNALIDPVSAARAFTGFHLPRPNDAIAPIEEYRRGLFEARGAAYHATLRDLRSAERQLADHLLRVSADACTAKIADLEMTERSPDLFGEPRGLDPVEERERQSLVATLHEVEHTHRLVSEDQLPFFAFEVHAPRTMRRGGFDVVVGNPPWVRAERLSAPERERLKRRFQWWQATGRRGYAHLPDLALAFVERGLELTRSGGVLALLLPSKVATAGYGEKARAALVRDTTLHVLHRVSDSEAAQFGATTYPLVVILRRRAPDAEHEVVLGFRHSARVRQSSLRRPGPWILVPDRDRLAIDDFLQSAPPLSDTTQVALGVKTGADAIFVGSPTARRGVLTRVQFERTETWLERTILRQVVRGRDVSPFTVARRKIMIWGVTMSGHIRHRIPALAHAYVADNAKRLRARADYRDGPLWTVFRTTAACSLHRVVWPDLARRPKATYLEAACSEFVVPLNTCYCATVPSSSIAHTVAGVLNSVWVVPYIAVSADEARGTYRRLNARTMNRVPIPTTTARTEAVVAASDRAHQQRHADQDELDEAVAAALDLPASTRTRLRYLADTYRR